MCRFVACGSRIKVDRQTDRQTHTHTDGQTKYSNPRCACAPRVNNSGSKRDWKESIDVYCKMMPMFTLDKKNLMSDAGIV